METNWNVNTVVLCGRVSSRPLLSHVAHQESFYIFMVDSRRLSGVDDHIKVLCPEKLLREAGLEIGDIVTVRGALRSYNNKSGVGSRLVITVLAQELTHEDSCAENMVLLNGTLCKTPIFRKTPLGREITDLLLAVNRRYGRADYLPCIVWGVQAREFAECDVGTRVSIEGRIQSRTYHKIEDGMTIEKMAYEVSVCKISLFQEDV